MKYKIKKLVDALLAIVFTASAGGCLLAMVAGLDLIFKNEVQRGEGLLAVVVLMLSSAYAIRIAYGALCRLFRR